MEFTKDIKFNRKPKNNKLLKMTYSGKLFQENSDEVYIVYGYGENWENTSEQKMEKTENGFITAIRMQNYNTFNFCFRNSNNVWDNNNSFNYISEISTGYSNVKINYSNPETSNDVCLDVIDNILNYINLNVDNTKLIDNVDTIKDDNLLDALINDLFGNVQETVQEQVQENISVIETTEEASPVSVTPDLNESEFDKLFDNTSANIVEEKTTAEYFQELSDLFDNVINAIETKESQSPAFIDIGTELDKIFEETFCNSLETASQATVDTEPDLLGDNVDFAENEALTETFSDIVKNISNIETTTDKKVDNLNYDYSDFSDIFDFVKENDNKEEKETITDTYFDYNNLDFDLGTTKKANRIIHKKELEKIVNTVEPVNNFSDSFYDDEDNSLHPETYNDFQQVIETIAEDIDNNEEKIEATATNLFESEEFEKESAEFALQIQEYTEYFDKLVEEIVSTPISSLSSTVSNETVLENNNVSLATTEETSLETTQKAEATENKVNTDGVPDEYALYDYKTQSFFTSFKRRFKLLVNSIFTKLPQLFGKERNTDN